MGIGLNENIGYVYPLQLQMPYFAKIQVNEETTLEILP
jgi:hypothetical protein